MGLFAKSGLRIQLIVLFFLVAAATTSFSQPQKPIPKKRQAEPAITATVTAVDQKAQSITIRQKFSVTRYRAVSKVVVDKNGKRQTVTSNIPVNEIFYVLKRLRLKDHKAYQLNGRRIAASVALKRLKPKSTVLLSPTPMLTAAQRKKLPSNSLILIPIKSSLKKKPKSN